MAVNFDAQTKRANPLCEAYGDNESFERHPGYSWTAICVGQESAQPQPQTSKIEYSATSEAVKTLECNIVYTLSFHQIYH